MGEINEELLSSWLRLSTCIVNEKLVSDMPYNESLICSILYKNQMEHPEKKLTATDLCSRIHMLKSQMNRTLVSMEQKNYITRERSTLDKRQIFITLNPEQMDLYQKQHRKILSIIDKLIEKMGEDKALEAIRTFQLIADTAEEVL